MEFFSTSKGPLSFSLNGTLDSSGCSCEGFLYLSWTEYRKTKCPKELSNIAFSTEAEIVLFRKKSPFIHFLLKRTTEKGKYKLVGETRSNIGHLVLSQLQLTVPVLP